MHEAVATNLETMVALSASNDTDMAQFLAGIERQALGVASVRLRHREDAMDVVQESMLRMASRYAGKPPQEWAPLFWSILRRRIIDLQRRRKVRSIMLRWAPGQEGEDGPAPERDPPDPGQGPFDTLADAQAMDALREALRELPQRQFEAFSLRVLNELDVAATARAMGCSEGSVKTHLSRARAALRARLEDWQ